MFFEVPSKSSLSQGANPKKGILATPEQSFNDNYFQDLARQTTRHHPLRRNEQSRFLYELLRIRPKMPDELHSLDAARISIRSSLVSCFFP